MQSRGWPCPPLASISQDQGCYVPARGSPEGEITQLSLVPVGRLR